tara:strand:+ start:1179 stop:1403 length:225 start_codon:yes stop_codon:yes gene_type:complete
MSGKLNEALMNDSMIQELKSLGLTIRDLKEAEKKMKEHGSGSFNVNKMSSIKDIIKEKQKKKKTKKTKKKTRTA